jgi:hypothetical protein
MAWTISPRFPAKSSDSWPIRSANSASRGRTEIHAQLNMLAADFLPHFRAYLPFVHELSSDSPVSGAGSAAYRHCRLVDAPG